LCFLLNRTQFAPDFQALPANVEYVECEDEFDNVVVSTTENSSNGVVGGDGPVVVGSSNNVGHTADGGDGDDDGDQEENEPVDVITIEPVPVFQSDSEDEEDVFHFETRIVKPPQSATQQ
jgi:hypothetical protein